MSDEKETPKTVAQPMQRTWTEAPTSATVKTRYAGREWMITVRDDTVNGLIGKAEIFSAWLDKNTDSAINLELPQNVPAPVVGVPAPQASAPQTGPQRVQCVMIEIGTSYTGGKTQLKFACDGMEFPLTYTKPMGDMVKLLAPLGFTSAHIVSGKKYPVNCFVTYHESESNGKNYKNVDKVEAATA
jgi:hypothetical protein